MGICVMASVWLWERRALLVDEAKGVSLFLSLNHRKFEPKVRWGKAAIKSVVNPTPNTQRRVEAKTLPLRRCT